MMKPQSKLLTALLLTIVILLVTTSSQAQDPLQLARDEVVVLMGGTNMVRLQQAGYFESILTQSFASSRPTFRDLAWEALSSAGEKMVSAHVMINSNALPQT